MVAFMAARSDDQSSREFSVGNPVPDELLQQIGVMLTQSCCDHALMHNSETREL